MPCSFEVAYGWEERFVGTELERTEGSPPTLYDAEEWTYGDPLAPEAHDPDKLPPPLPGKRRMGRALARIRRMIGLRAPPLRS